MEKVIKMRVSKKGKEEFLVKWVGYPLSQATWNHLKTFPGKKLVSMPPIPFQISCNTNKNCLLKKIKKPWH